MADDCIDDISTDRLQREIAARTTGIQNYSTAGAVNPSPDEHASMPQLPPVERPMPNAADVRGELIKRLTRRLGGGSVEVELDPEDYNIAVDQSVRRYRQRSSNSMEQTLMFLVLKEGQSRYRLPAEVQDVRKLYRRGIGSHSGTGVDLDPFELSYTYLYILQAGRYGGLTNYELFRQFQDTAGRLFGSDLDFKFNTDTKDLDIFRRIRNEETIIVDAYAQRPEAILLEDVYGRQWLEDYALAVCKMIIAEARGKFQSLGGPAGGVVLNADTLRTEAATEMERLEQEIKNYAEGNEPPKFFFA